MSNHFHLLIETPKGNLAGFMRKFNITYTAYFNWRHKRVGHLYQGRYKSILVDRNSYLSVLSRYIHLNPVKIKAMKKVPDKARKEYKRRIYSEIAEGADIKENIIGQSILGGEEFIAWVKEQFIDKMKDRERPSVGVIHRYRTKDEVLSAVKRETAKDIEAIRAEKGELRRVVMEVLYHEGGLKGSEIGRLFGIDYGSVSQERKRLREKLQKDRKAQSAYQQNREKIVIKLTPMTP